MPGACAYKLETFVIAAKEFAQHNSVENTQDVDRAERARSLEQDPAQRGNACFWSFGQQQSLLSRHTTARCGKVHAYPHDDDLHQRAHQEY